MKVKSILSLCLLASSLSLSGCLFEGATSTSDVVESGKVSNEVVPSNDKVSEVVVSTSPTNEKLSKDAWVKLISETNNFSFTSNIGGGMVKGYYECDDKVIYGGYNDNRAYWGTNDEKSGFEWFIDYDESKNKWLKTDNVYGLATDSLMGYEFLKSIAESYDDLAYDSQTNTYSSNLKMTIDGETLDTSLSVTIENNNLSSINMSFYLYAFSPNVAYIEINFNNFNNIRITLPEFDF